MDRFLRELPAVIAAASRAVFVAIARQVSEWAEIVDDVSRRAIESLRRATRLLWRAYIGIEGRVVATIADGVLTIYALRFFVLLVAIAFLLAWVGLWLVLSGYVVVLIIATVRYFQLDRAAIQREAELTEGIRRTLQVGLRWCFRILLMVVSIYLSMQGLAPWALSVALRHTAASQLIPALPSRTTLATAPSDAPDEYVDVGACPYEGCRYGERWLSLQDVPVFRQRPDSLNSTEPRRPLKALPNGQWVTTITGAYFARRSTAKVELSLKPTYGHGSSGPPLKDGQIIPVYGGLGEGCSRVWIAGTFPVVCGLTSVSAEQSKTAWWVLVKTRDGTEVWTQSGDAWISQDGLDYQIGQAISNDKLSVRDKLATIDRNVKLGGQLNRIEQVGYSGISPLGEALGTSDVDLLKALQDRGMNFREACYRDALLVSTTTRVEAIAFLIDSGLDLRCLSDSQAQATPVAHGFLLHHVNGEPYSVDGAIRLAQVLSDAGVDLSAKDSTGRSILDVLAEKNAKQSGRLAPLIAQLTQLQASRF